jgi:SRSO17 transposase
MLRTLPSKNMVDRSELSRNPPALEGFLEEFHGCAIAPTRRLIAAYVRGQLSALPRKSVLPMARAAGIPPRTLQELLSLHRWDEERMRELVLKRAAAFRKAPGTLFVTESLCPKKGTKTPGVERQSVGGARPANGVALVQLGFADNGFACLVESALHLPASWAGDLERRRAAGVPEGLRFRSRPELALELLSQAASGGLEPAWVLMPAAYGEDGAFLAALAARGLPFVVESPAPGKLPERLPREIRAVTAAAGVALLTNVPTAGPPELLDVWRSRERQARRLADLKLEVGHDHFEVRSWRSLRRHLVLSSASILFLAEQRARAAHAGALPAAPPLPLRWAR